ncbi:MAG TPA: cation transporter [Firmicutes bacterium]|nr:cation transporter [Candidatus Fermentithermobacillaceae bacterium]
MIRFLIARFVKDYQNVADKNVREAYGTLAGTLGIVCNVLLFALKISIGLLTNSVAVISDAVNNLTDTGSSVVAILGAKMTNRPPDKEHPYGHGRSEYIASLVVSFIIFAMGVELMRTSFGRLLSGEKVLWNPYLTVALALSVLVKVWMFSYNRYIANVIDSKLSRAAAKDSLSDAFATGAVVMSTVLGRYTAFPVDGVLGMAISVAIMYTGFSTARDSIDQLLGLPPDPEMRAKIEATVMSSKSILGAHDLRVHDYGPGRTLASIHVQVSDEANIVEIHNEIDRIEKQIEKELGVSMVIHVDPEPPEPGHLA